MQRAFDTSRVLAALAWSLGAPGAAQNAHDAPHGSPAALGALARATAALDALDMLRLAQGDLRRRWQGARLVAPERAVAERFLASLVVHDHGGM